MKRYILSLYYEVSYAIMNLSDCALSSPSFLTMVSLCYCSSSVQWRFLWLILAIMLNNGFWNPLCICVYFLGLLYILDSNLELDGHVSTAIPLIRIHSIYTLAAHFESLYLFINITHIFQLIDCSIFEKFFVYDLMSYYLWIHLANWAAFCWS